MSDNISIIVAFSLFAIHDGNRCLFYYRTHNMSITS